jgi:hypothetical protein
MRPMSESTSCAASNLVTQRLPVEFVFAPAWWNKREGITFDEDFFYHPARRVEVERRMEKALYDRWGGYGLGADHQKDHPVVGPVHLAAGYLVSEMLGCEVHYREAGPPEVVPSTRADLFLDEEAVFRSPAYARFNRLVEALKARFGRLEGDVNWGGVLNIAMDLRGQRIFEDMYDQPVETGAFFAGIGRVIERFVGQVEQETGTSSVAVNRSVRFFRKPVYLHSECSHTMISVDDYETFLMPIDQAWSRNHDVFGIHYCGADPHRYAGAFAKIPKLAFLDVGWGGDLKILRAALPDTFLNIRLSPVELVGQTVGEIRAVVRRLVADAGDSSLTGLCCVNMDDKVTDEKVTAILETAAEMRARQA